MQDAETRQHHAVRRSVRPLRPVLGDARHMGSVHTEEEQAKMKRSFVTRYGSPDTKRLVEHEENECAACKVVGGMPEKKVIFMIVQPSDSDEEEIRRIEGLGPLEPGAYVSPSFVAVLTEQVPFANECRAVSRREVEDELSIARAEGRSPCPIS